MYILVAASPTSSVFDTKQLKQDRFLPYELLLKRETSRNTDPQCAIVNQTQNGHKTSSAGDAFKLVSNTLFVIK